MTRPTEPPKESAVRYYLEGWRFGILEGVKGEKARIRPIAAYKAHPRAIWVPLEDVEIAKAGEEK